MIDHPEDRRDIGESATHPVVKQAQKKARLVPGQEMTLENGVRVRLKAVSPAEIADISASVKDPPVPRFYDDERGREIEHPNDPAYLEALLDARRERTMCSLETVIMFGFDLLDPVPSDEEDDWVARLRFMESRGRFNFHSLDPDEPMSREFLYRKHIISTNDFKMLSIVSGVGREEVDSAFQSFPDQEAQPAD